MGRILYGPHSKKTCLRAFLAGKALKSLLSYRDYGKGSKVSNTFLFLLIIRAGTDKMLARKANSESPDQTASSEV